MIKRDLLIGRWIVEFLFALRKYDIPGVIACLYDAGARNEDIDRAENIMQLGYKNTGFTFTNSVKHRAVVVVGPVTSDSQFINTLVHEVHHLAVAIAEDADTELNSETPAYIAGDSINELADLVCELGCGKKAYKYRN